MSARPFFGRSLFTAYFLILLLLTSCCIGPQQNGGGFFTIVVLPDTQKYSRLYPEIFLNQTGWIVENKDAENIMFVVHLGDIVDTASSKKQWGVADAALSELDVAGIPYNVVRGNHDTGSGEYFRLFGADRFEDRGWYKGSFGDNSCSYQSFDAYGVKYLMLGLDYCPGDDEVRWANGVLDSSEYDFAILSTHAFLGADGSYKTHGCGDTSYIWEDIVRRHENLRIVLSGHVHAAQRRSDENNYGNMVYQLLSDYQGDELGGGGYLRLMRVYPGKDEVRVRTYSPFYGRYLGDVDNDFTLDVS